jgi:hypothetical protein
MLSVVLTLLDHRGHVAECVGSWTRGQTLPRDRYEVIIVGTGGEMEVEDAVRPILTPRDRLLRREVANELALHDHGARQAQGRWLVFTEAHCVAEPTCLAALLAHLEASWPRDAGACFRSTTDGSADSLARLEARWYQDGFAEWSRDGDWRKVTIRAFALRREVFLDVGGFEHEFGCFAEAALAATLHARGYRLGYAPAAAVKHYNSTSLEELLGYVREYREGEVAYQARCRAEHFEAYFGGGASSAEPGGLDRWWALGCAARSLGRALASLHRPRSAPMARTMLGVLVGSSWSALLGGHPARLWAGLAYGWARVRFARPWVDAEERYRRYRRLWEAAGEVARLRAVSRRPELPPPVTASAADYRPGEMAVGALRGFHAREIWNGRPFRWTFPLAWLPLRIPPGDYEVVLETNGLRGGDLRGLVDLYFNAHKAPLAPRWRTDPEPGRLAFLVDRAMFRPAAPQRLALASSRVRPENPTERRALGVPLFEIVFRPIES